MIALVALFTGGVALAAALVTSPWSQPVSVAKLGDGKSPGQDRLFDPDPPAEAADDADKVAAEAGGKRTGKTEDLDDENALAAEHRPTVEPDPGDGESDRATRALLENTFRINGTVGAGDAVTPESSAETGDSVSHVHLSRGNSLAYDDTWGDLQTRHHRGADGGRSAWYGAEVDDPGTLYARVAARVDPAAKGVRLFYVEQADRRTIARLYLDDDTGALEIVTREGAKTGSVPVPRSPERFQVLFGVDTDGKTAEARLYLDGNHDLDTPDDLVTAAVEDRPIGRIDGPFRRVGWQDGTESWSGFYELRDDEWPALAVLPDAGDPPPEEDTRSDIASTDRNAGSEEAPSEPDDSGSVPADPDLTSPPSNALDALDVPGVDGDGDSADDLQAAIDRAASENRPLWLPDPPDEYRLDRPLDIPSGSRIHAHPDAVVRAISGRFGSGEDMVSLTGGVSDVEIAGGEWRLPKDEGRNVFNIRYTTDVILRDLLASDAYYDGVYVGHHPDGTNTDLELTRLRLNENARNGLSVAVADGLLVQDLEAHDNGHILECANVCVEPVSNAEGVGVLKDVRFVNVSTANNPRAGMTFSLGNFSADNDDIDILVENLTSVEDGTGLRASQSGAGGLLEVRDATFHRNDDNALQLRNRWASSYQTNIVRPVITDYAVAGSSGRNGAAISLYAGSSHGGNGPIGNVRIVEPSVSRRLSGSAPYMWAHDRHGYGIENVQFVDPVRLDGGAGFDIEDSGIEFSDAHDQL